MAVPDRAGHTALEHAWYCSFDSIVSVLAEELEDDAALRVRGCRALRSAPCSRQGAAWALAQAAVERHRAVALTRHPGTRRHPRRGRRQRPHCIWMGGRLRLADGRWLSHRGYGDPGGTPILFMRTAT